jgi:hypothetical protein
MFSYTCRQNLFSHDILVRSQPGALLVVQDVEFGFVQITLTFDLGTSSLLAERKSSNENETLREFGIFI